MDHAGLSVEEVTSIMGPLAEVWNLRCSIIAHVGGSLPKGDLGNHFRALLQRCDSTMRRLAELVESGMFVMPLLAMQNHQS
jgi:hypothetical protein